MLVNSLNQIKSNFSNVYSDISDQEISAIYGGLNYSNVIYYKENTINGDAPLSFKSTGEPIENYIISGNTVQNGTPTPDNPVDVVGCGEKTENLFDKSTITIGKYIDSSGNEATSTGTGEQVLNHSDYIEINAETIYTFKCTKAIEQTSNSNAFCWFDSSKQFISRDVFNIDVDVAYTIITATAPTGAAYLIINYRGLHGDTAMLNTGSVALPYEPYGYKLPVTVNGTEYPIYLGQVPTTRRIRKLVLTGEEDWVYRAPEPSSTFFIEIAEAIFINNHGLCTHYLNQDSGGFSELADKHVLIRNSLDGTKSYIGLRDSSFTKATFEGVSELKEYLAAQYAAGTPVTVWYVLAEPETGIVNEPLMKIGDYADTLNSTQSGVNLSTINGTNIITTSTTVLPSDIEITGRIKTI